MLSEAGLLAIWREIIGMALTQQGGITIAATATAMAAARAHFGASLDYKNFSGALDELAYKGRMIGVLTLAEAVAPPAGIGVFARLPLIGAATALCYGAVAQEDIDDDAVSLVRRDAPMQGDKVLYQGADYALVETMAAGSDAVWGRYLILGNPL